jgi:hypothetical protein
LRSAGRIPKQNKIGALGWHEGGGKPSSGNPLFISQGAVLLTQSKDDSLAMLVLHLFIRALNTKSVAPDMLRFAALSAHPTDSQSLSDIEQIIKSCYKIMEVDPPTFRICTYQEASLLIDKLLEIYEGVNKKPP